jgi:flagellar basal-body rod protein FlgB
MGEGLEAVTTAALGFALDAAVLRQHAIASNVANAGVVGYVPVRLSFSAQFDQLREGVLAQGDAHALRAAGGRLQLESILDAHGRPAKIQLDAEMASMAQNNVLYQALIKGLNRHLTIQSLAANDGKR